MNKQYYYTVERLQGNEWVVVCQTDFDDVEQFKLIAQTVGYRILYNGNDITHKYNSNYTSFSMPGQANEKPVAMKPSQFKALSIEEQSSIIDQIAKLKEKKCKRAEILEMLNITESTYDAINAEAKSAAAPATSKPPEVKSSPELSVHTLKRGLFAKR